MVSLGDANTNQTTEHTSNPINAAPISAKTTPRSAWTHTRSVLSTGYSASIVASLILPAKQFRQLAGLFKSIDWLRPMLDVWVPSDVEFGAVSIVHESSRNADTILVQFHVAQLAPPFSEEVPQQPILFAILAAVSDQDHHMVCSRVTGAHILYDTSAAPRLCTIVPDFMKLFKR
jgi:hypothetical protein